ncbi:MAG: FdtA/QdtA family cupin domain-containing protein [Bacteroidota bacterium]
MPSIDNISWKILPSVFDNRGVLTSIESDSDVPIVIKRIFYMHHLVSDRGGHAHTDTDQVVIAISGSFKIELYDGKNKISFSLDDPTKGLYIPRMIFINIFDFSEDAVCMVLANTHYDIKKSIRSIDEYIKIINIKS